MDGNGLPICGSSLNSDTLAGIFTLFGTVFCMRRSRFLTLSGTDSRIFGWPLSQKSGKGIWVLMNNSTQIPKKENRYPVRSSRIVRSCVRFLRSRAEQKWVCLVRLASVRV